MIEKIFLEDKESSYYLIKSEDKQFAVLGDLSKMAEIKDIKFANIDLKSTFGKEAPKISYKIKSEKLEEESDDELKKDFEDKYGIKAEKVFFLYENETVSDSEQELPDQVIPENNEEEPVDDKKEVDNFPD